MITAASHLNGLLKMFEQILLLGLLPKHDWHRLVELTNYQGQHLQKMIEVMKFRDFLAFLFAAFSLILEPLKCQRQCTMCQAIELGSLKVLKSKGIFIAQF